MFRQKGGYIKVTGQIDDSQSIFNRNKNKCWCLSVLFTAKTCQYEAVDTGIQGGGDWMTGRASNEGSRRFHNHGEGPGAFFWLKAPTCALTLKTLVRAEKNGKVATK